VDFPEVGQRGHGSGSPMAEREARSDGDVPSVQPPDQHALDEFLG
jgi:hypothetical protein